MWDISHWPAYPPTGHLFTPRGGLALVEQNNQTSAVASHSAAFPVVAHSGLGLPELIEVCLAFPTILFEVDAKRQRSRLVPLLQVYPGEDAVSSHSAGISSDFTPLGSIRKLEDPVISSAILISQGETYTKYLGRIYTGTSMLIAALSAVATMTRFERALFTVTE